MISEDERRRRIAAALLEEKLHGKMRWWWVSFTNDGKFSGVAIVEAMGPAGAIRRTHDLAINPGGWVLPVDIPEDRAGGIPAEAKDRLLDLETLRGFFPDLVRRDGTPV